MTNKAHKCDQMEPEATIEYSEQWKMLNAKLESVTAAAWGLRIEDYGDWSFIKYCPYCGVKLDD